VEAPVSPAVGDGMFTPFANQLPVLWSTGKQFFAWVLDLAVPKTRQALTPQGRTGPTAGETGPRCGRTCGATRQQRNDDSPLTLNHAPKKGGVGKMIALCVGQRPTAAIALTAKANRARSSANRRG